MDWIKITPETELPKELLILKHIEGDLVPVMPYEVEEFTPIIKREYTHYCIVTPPNE